MKPSTEALSNWPDGKAQRHSAAHLTNRQPTAKNQHTRYDGEEGMTVNLEIEELWALWRDLSEQARVLEETAAVFRDEARKRRANQLNWGCQIKEAIRREGKARRLRDRAAAFKRRYWQEKQAAKISAYTHDPNP
jgi:hypothetical protein